MSKDIDTHNSASYQGAEPIHSRSYALNSENENKQNKISCSGCSHEHNHSGALDVKELAPIIFSTVLLVLGLILEHTVWGASFPSYVYPIFYILAYIPVAFPVLREAVEAVIHEKDFFNEFSLMGIATIGALSLGEYPEAVAVMLLYSIGELFQSMAVGKATKNIESLLDVRVEEARRITPTGIDIIPSEEVKIGDRFQLRVGDKLPVDGVLFSDKASFNTVALTGESVPQTKRRGEPVLAGMINLDGVIEIESSRVYKDSALSKILEMVQEATERKAKTELLMRKFARWYTPAVFGLAVVLAFLPALLVSDYVFTEWLYRALVFLVISCPCALVISIPLGYFGGIGAASRKGILFKGANYLDQMSHVNTVVVDKTGTMTEGVFEVQEVFAEGDRQSFLDITSAVESFSSHPIAQAILAYHNANQAIIDRIENIEEVAGHGVKCELDGDILLVGNYKLLDKFGVSYDSKVKEIVGTTILVSKGNQYLGAIHIADKIKEDAEEAVLSLHQSGVKNIIMLSGDNPAITQEVGDKIGIDKAIGGLLPQEKVAYVEDLKKNPKNVICFVGDGINDAPSLALSDIGIAMGAMGADAAIEVADVVIQTDQPSKISKAIKIAKATRKIVFQNIALAFSIKLFVLLLGALGIATMWEAVIADVGVTILAVLNAVRILYKKDF